MQEPDLVGSLWRLALAAAAPALMPAPPGPPQAATSPAAPEAPLATPAPPGPAAPAAAKPPEAPKDDETEKKRLSGRHWKGIADEKWPGSQSVDTLSPEFKPKVQALLKMLEDNKIKPEISATNRPKELAYLFHYCLEVASGRAKKPGEVEKLSTVDINWDHGDDAKSKAAAKEMADAWGLVGIAAYPSNHTGGNAIDMKFDYTKNTDKDGKTVLTYKLDGKTETTRTLKIDDEAVVGQTAKDKTIANIKDREVSKAGADYGVIRAINNDIVHWSLNGT